jgi:hypothetical protein
MGEKMARVTPSPERKGFSDEDLRVLKAMTESGDLPISGKQLRPLLDRLDVAEWAMTELERHERKGYLHSDLVEPLEAWRRSKGESE